MLPSALRCPIIPSVTRNHPGFLQFSDSRGMLAGSAIGREAAESLKPGAAQAEQKR